MIDADFECALAALSSRLSIVDMVRVAKIVESVPAVEAEPVVHARWTFTSLDQIAPNCSHCGAQSIMGYSRCPHCGAHMDEEVADVGV